MDTQGLMTPPQPHRGRRENGMHRAHGAPLRPTASDLARELNVCLATTHAEVDDRALSRLGEHLRRTYDARTVSPVAWNDPAFWLLDAPPAERSQYFTVGAALDFRFWRLVRGRAVPLGGSLRGQHLNGAMYMWRCLRLAVDERRMP